MRDRVSEVKAAAAALRAADHHSDTERLPWGQPGEYRWIPVAPSPLRGPINTLGVDTDAGAVAVWLADCASHSVHTAAAYRKEAERLLLWASEMKGLSLSQLTRAHYLEFSQFLKSVPESWISYARYRRSDPRWRPFLHQPSAASIGYCLTVVYGMISYLCEAGWLIANPMPKAKLQRVAWTPTDHAIPPKIMALVSEATLPQATETPNSKAAIMRARDRWIVTFMSCMAPRVSETSALTGSIKQLHLEGDLAWIWEAKGKGGKPFRVPVPDYVMSELMTFRALLNIPAAPLRNDPVPIIPSLKHMTSTGQIVGMPTPLSRSAIYRRLTEVVFPAAKALAAERGIDASMLDFASPHWMRHTAITALYSKTKDIKLAQMLGRHSSMSTTSGYTQKNLSELLSAMELIGSVSAASTTPGSTTAASTTPGSTTAASTTPASTTAASTTPASTTPASTTPASTTPASTTPASTTPASAASASAASASTTPASAASASTSTESGRRQASPKELLSKIIEIAGIAYC